MAENFHISSFSKIPPLNNDQPVKKPQKVLLVLIHGWGLNAAVWQPFIENLPLSFTDVFQVKAIDLPGFGTKVDKKLSDYSLANICQIIADEISQPAIYLGWSLGGLVATEMAISYPDKVLSLITLASSPYFLEERTKNSTEKCVVWPGIKAKVLDSFHQQLQVDTKKTVNGFLKIQAMGSPHIRQDIKQISELVFQYKIANKTTLDQSLSLLITSDYRKNLQAITQPFLRLYGEADGLVPKAVIDQVTQLVPMSDLHIFKQASHAPFISHSDDFQAILIHWLFDKRKDNTARSL